MVIHRGRTGLLHEGIGLVYGAEDVVGRLVIERVDEEISLGRLTIEGFFDRISPGDDVFLTTERRGTAPSGSASLPADPELRSLLRTLR